MAMKAISDPPKSTPDSILIAMKSMKPMESKQPMASTQEKKPKETDINAELFARCRAASTMAHFAHLMTDSYAAHMALGSFYDSIIDLADNVAEQIIGRYGKFTSFPTIPTDNTDAISIVEELRTWIDDNRNDICPCSEVQNSIDEIVSLCNSTLYKLKELS